MCTIQRAARSAFRKVSQVGGMRRVREAPSVKCWLGSTTGVREAHSAKRPSPVGRTQRVWCVREAPSAKRPNRQK